MNNVHVRCLLFLFLVSSSFFGSRKKVEHTDHEMQNNLPTLPIHHN